MSTFLIRVEAPHFVAGIELTDAHPALDSLLPLTEARVTRTAPILKYTLGWPEGRLYALLRRKGWHWQVIPPNAGHYWFSKEG